MVEPLPPEHERSTFLLYHTVFVESVIRASGKRLGFVGLQMVLRVAIRALTANEIKTLISELNDLKLLCIDYLAQNGEEYEENSG